MYELESVIIVAITYNTLVRHFHEFKGAYFRYQLKWCWKKMGYVIFDWIIVPNGISAVFIWFNNAKLEHVKRLKCNEKTRLTIMIKRHADQNEDKVKKICCFFPVTWMDQRYYMNFLIYVNRFIYKMATEAAGARIEWETIAV